MVTSEQTPLLAKSDEQFEVSGSIRKKYRLEPALVLMFFGWNLSESIIQNQLLKQTCIYKGYSLEDCSHLGSQSNVTIAIEKIIQPTVAEISMTSKLLVSVVPAFLSLFLGPWSDKYGRKKILCWAFSGYSVALACFSIISLVAHHVDRMSPWMYLFPYIPLFMSGGWPLILVAVSCYTMDISTDTNRSLRLGIIEMIMFVGILGGTASSSFILKLTSSTAVFLISLVCVLLALIYTICCVPESVKVFAIESPCEQLKELFSPVPVVDMARTCFKRRHYNERKIVWCIIVILVLSVVTVAGSSNVSYLFVRSQLHWTLRDFTLYDSTTILMSTIGCVMGITLFKMRLHFSDLSLLILALISKIINPLIIGFATQTWQMYLASVFGMFRILIVPMNQSIIGHFIPKHEIGKIFGMKVSLEAISALLSAPLYTFVYSKTFTFFAGAFFMVTVLIGIVNLIIALCVLRLIRNRRKILDLQVAASDEDLAR